MKILIMQLRQLGDILLSSTLAKAIKKYLIDAKVDFLTSSNAKEILTLNPFIDNILTLDKGIINELCVIKKIRLKKYDYLIDVQRTATTKRISFFSLAKEKIAFRKANDNFYYNNLVDHENCVYTVDDRMLLLKPLHISVKEGEYLPELYYDKKTENKVKSLLGSINLKSGTYFVIMPTARRKIKSWPLESFTKLIDNIYRQLSYIPVVVVAPNESFYLEEIKRNSNIKFYGFSNLNIKELACLIKESKFFIGNDSFGAHIAISQEIKSFIIVGFSSGWFPKNENTIIMMSHIDCQPCNDWKKCPHTLKSGYLKCFDSLQVSSVLKAIKSHIKPMQI